jgi:hypothetical protein
MQLDIAKLSDAQIIALLHSEEPLSQARRVFTNECGRIEQAGNVPPIEWRRMELQAVQRIAAALGVAL